jgi:hypothetical protein
LAGVGDEGRPEMDVPIACDLSGSDQSPQERLAEFADLFARHLVVRSWTADGVLLRLDGGADVVAWAEDLSARERACCPFFRFSVTAAGDDVLWLVSVVDDPVARGVLGEFYEMATVGAGLDGDRG